MSLLSINRTFLSQAPDVKVGDSPLCLFSSVLDAVDTDQSSKLHYESSPKTDNTHRGIQYTAARERREGGSWLYMCRGCAR